MVQMKFGTLINIHVNVCVLLKDKNNLIPQNGGAIMEAIKLITKALK